MPGNHKEADRHSHLVPPHNTPIGMTQSRTLAACFTHAADAFDATKPELLETVGGCTSPRRRNRDTPVPEQCVFSAACQHSWGSELDGVLQIQPEPA